MKAIKFNKENLYMVLGNYSSNNNLYIGLITKSGEDYCDLTINIPNYLFEFDDEVIINGDTSNELVEVLEDLGILVDTYKIAFSGFGRYKVMIFNEEVAKEYIKEDYRGDEE